MHVSRDAVAKVLRERGDGEAAERALAELPHTVDTEAGDLSGWDVSREDLLAWLSTHEFGATEEQVRTDVTPKGPHAQPDDPASPGAEDDGPVPGTRAGTGTGTGTGTAPVPSAPAPSGAPVAGGPITGGSDPTGRTGADDELKAGGARTDADSGLDAGRAGGAGDQP